VNIGSYSTGKPAACQAIPPPAGSDRRARLSPSGRQHARNPQERELEAGTLDLGLGSPPETAVVVVVSEFKLFDEHQYFPFYKTTDREPATFSLRFQMQPTFQVFSQQPEKHFTSSLLRSFNLCLPIFYLLKI
jgi:hypothetical protein